MVLIEPPPLLESVAGRKYHYPPAFHRRLWLLSKGLNVILIARSTEVVAYGSCDCRDFIPAAGLTFSRCCYSPYTCIGVEVEHLTTVFLLRFQKLVKFAQNPAFLFVYILLRGMQQGSTFGFCFILEIDHSDQFSLIIG